MFLIIIFHKVGCIKKSSVGQALPDMNKTITGWVIPLRLFYKPSPSFPLQGEGRIIIISLGRNLERGFIFCDNFCNKITEKLISALPSPDMMYNKSTCDKALKGIIYLQKRTGLDAAIHKIFMSLRTEMKQSLTK